MTTIKLIYFTPISDISGKKSETITFNNTVTLDKLIRTITRECINDLIWYFYDKNGQYKPQCLVLYNGKYCSDLSQPLSDGDEISFIPPLAGG